MIVQNKIVLIVLAVGCFGLGFWTAARWRTAPPPDTAAAQPAETIWTCSMHPQIREAKPGKCRLCAMDLIPLDSGDGGTGGDRVISFAPDVLKLMEVETSAVARQAVSKDVPLVGKLTLDETLTRVITARTAGRIDRLFADFTGMRVNAGDHLAELYSPELIAAQAEFLESTTAQTRLGSDAFELVQRSTALRQAASRDKLLLLGLTETQVADIERQGKPLDHLTLYAPIGGVVIEKTATEGMYVETGTPIYTIAELNRLWVVMDAYESDLRWLRFGQMVEFTVEAWPGEVFTAHISFISPLLNDPTRTVRVRAVVENPDGRLKPNMLARAVVRAPLADGGRVIEPSLADKWICPMHGQIIKDAAGTCDICQMPLASAASLGYVAATEPQPPLVIPVTAALLTGQKLDRAVVYAVVQGADRPTYIGKQIVLGPCAGDMYVVLDGLMEGERVVTRGNFKIDSELQLRGKTSMMSAEPVVLPGEQTLCPVMGTPINKDIFVEYQGKKVYFCCPGCDKEFLADPEKYLPKLPQFKE